MTKKLKLEKLKTRHFLRILVLLVALFSVVFVLAWWQAGDKAEKEIIERIKTQELLTARSGALSMGEYFKPKAVSLILLSEMGAIKEGDRGKGEELIRVLMEELRGEPLVDIFWLDKEGQAKWATNLRGERVREEIYLGDRSYFQWAKEQKEPRGIFMSEPLISRGEQRGQESILVMATPVFYQEQFNGVVLMSFSVPELTKKYLTPLIFDPEDYVFTVTTQNGTILSTLREELIGKNIFTMISQNAWSAKEKEDFQKKIQESSEGKEGTFMHPDYTSVAKAKLITAYAPVMVKNQAWSLWVSVPYEKVVVEVMSLRFVQNQVLLVALIGIVVLVLVFIFGTRVAQKDGFMDGFLDGRDGVKKIKK